MEKLSGILKSSPRVKSVDMKNAAPVRPGAPSYGGPVGRSSVRDRITLSEQAKDLALADTLAVRNPKESSRAKLVEQINKNFFETRLDRNEPTVSEQVSASVGDSVGYSPEGDMTSVPETVEDSPAENQSLPDRQSV